MKKASEIAHRNGFKFLLTPLYQDIRKYDTQFAPYCDMVNLQIPHFIPDYAAAVQRAVTNIRKANPKAVVMVQLQPVSRTSREKTNTHPKEIIQAWKSVSHLVDGVLVFYYKDPDPIPILNEFYDSALATQPAGKQEQEKAAVNAPLQAKPISILDALARSERVMYVGAHADDENSIAGLLAAPPAWARSCIWSVSRAARMNRRMWAFRKAARWAKHACNGCATRPRSWARVGSTPLR